MSHEATAWAFRQKLPALQKLVLVTLADRHNKDTGRCDPSMARVADDCGMSRESVRNAVRALEERGLLKSHQRFNGSAPISNFYTFPLDGESTTLPNNEGHPPPHDAVDPPPRDGHKPVNKPGSKEPGSTSVKKKNSSQDDRHGVFLEDFRYYYRLKVKADAPWDPKEAGRFASWLKANPTITREQWRLILNNRARSPVSHAKRLSVWVDVALAWLDGPADDWGKRLVQNGGKNGVVSRGKTDSNLAVLQELNAEEERANGAAQDGLFPPSEPDEE